MQSWRPVSRATWRNVSSRAAFEAKLENPALCRLYARHQAIAHAAFRATRPGVEGIGRIADKRENTPLPDRLDVLRIDSRPKDGLVVQLPVAGMEYPAMRRIDHDSIHVRDRMGERHIAQPERAQGECPSIFDHLELDIVGKPLFLKLAADQGRRKRCGIKRHI